MIRHVRHAVPFQFTAARGRVERLAMRGGVTTVRVAEIAEREIECVRGDPSLMVARPEFRPCIDDRDMPLFAHDGRLWLRADRHVVDRKAAARGRLAIGSDGAPWMPSSTGRVPHRPDDLDETVDAPHLSLLGRRLYGCPARTVGSRMPLFGDVDRMHRSPFEWLGTAEYPGHRVTRDHGEEVSAAVTRFFDEEVRVSGGRVYLAWQGVHILSMPRPGRRRLVAPDGFEATCPQALAWHVPSGYVVRADRTDALEWVGQAFFQDAGPAPHPLRALSGRGHGDADVAAMAQDMPVRTWCLAYTMPGVPQDMVLDLMPRVAQGVMGAIPPGEMAGALQACLDVLRRVEGAGSRTGIKSPLARIASEYVRRVALPVLEGDGPLDRDDADALKGL